MTESKWLIKFDGPGVQRWIFKTTPLKEIRGASALVEGLGEQLPALPGLLRIYAGGGGGAVIVPESQRDTFLLKLEQCYREQAPGLALKYAMRPWRSDQAMDHQVATLSQALGQASFHLAPQVLVGPCAIHCSSCRQGVKDDEFHNHHLCQTCRSKRIGRESQVPPYLAALNPQTNKNLPQGWQAFCQLYHSDRRGEAVADYLPQELKQIAQLTKTRREYIAFIWADANNMGNTIRDEYQQRQGESLEGLAARFDQFSKDLSSGLGQVIAEAMVQTWPEGPAKIEDRPEPGRRANPNKHCLPLEVLFQGGDDVQMVCEADGALDFIKRLANGYQKRFSNLSLSFGVVFAKHNTPINSMREVASELLDAAKVVAKQGAEPQAAIDFLILNDAAVGDLDLLRKDSQTSDGARLHMRPMTLETLDTLVTQRKALEMVSLGRFHSLVAACRKGKTQGTMATFRLLGRMKKDNRESLVKALTHLGCRDEELPWIHHDQGSYTPLLDLLELATLMPNPKEAKK